MFVEKSRFHLLAVSAIVGFLFLSLMAFISAEKARNINEIKQVVTVGPRAAYHSGMLPQKYRDDSSLKVPASVVEEVKEHVKEELSKFYDVNSEIYKQRLQQHSEAVDAEVRTKERLLGGGVKKVESLNITLNGDTAKVEMIAIVWAKFKAEDGTIYKPENKVKYNFELNKIEGAWKITSEEFTYPEGI